MVNADIFAYVAYGLYIAGSAFAFVRMRPAQAVAVVFLGGVLFLPEDFGIDLQGLPPLNKRTIPIVLIAAACLLRHWRRFTTAHALRTTTIITVVPLMLAVGTVMTNGDTVVYTSYGLRPTTQLPGLSLYDAIAMIAEDVLNYLLPFLIGMLFIRTIKDLQDFLVVLVIMGLIYVPLMILEVAMSPQLHKWIYGFHQAGSFHQSIRFGGYRPVVFMSHGLAVSLFMCSAAMAGLGLGRAGVKLPVVPTAFARPILAMVLIASKSTATIFYYIATAPFMLFARPSTQMRVAMAMAVLVVLYPVMRAADIFPTEALVEISAAFGEQRARSVSFRFENETKLLERGGQRPLFGWGGFKRQRYFKHGKDKSTTDGFWIIVFGKRGVLGLAASLALLTLPIFIMAHRMQRVTGRKERVLVATLALVLAVYVLDLLPNGLFTPLPFLLSGSLFALCGSVTQRSEPIARLIPVPEPELPGAVAHERASYR